MRCPGRSLRAVATVAVLVCASVVGLAVSAQAVTEFRDLSWSSPSVDATAGTATNTVTFTATTTNAVQYVKFGLVGPEGTPLPSQYWVSFYPGAVEASRQAGEVSRVDGWSTYRYTFAVPRYAHTENAVWRVTQVGDAVLPDTLGYGFTARSAVDATAPGYTSLTAETSVWLVGSSPVDNYYRFASVEPEAGLAQFGVTLTGPGGDTLTGATFMVTNVPNPPSQLVNRTAVARVTFPLDKQVGTWTVTEIWAVDIVGNKATYEVSLAPVTFTDNAGIALSDITVTPTEVDNWNEAATSVVTANVTAPAPVTRAEVIADAPCAGGVATLPGGASGTVSVPVTVPVGTTECRITGLAVYDEAGHVSVRGTGHGSTELPLLTRKTGPGPEVRDIAVAIDSVEWNTYTRFDVTVDMYSWSPGVTRATLYVEGSNVNFPHYNNLPRVRDGKVTFTVHTQVSDLHTNELTVRVVLGDLAGKTTSKRDDQTIRVNRPAGLSGFQPADPTRLLDTRESGGPLGPGGSLALDTPVPPDATAVVLNVTAVAPTAASHLTVWPDGRPRPTASSLNYVAGQTVSNTVTVPVSADGKIRLHNNSGSVHLVVDFFGYYSSTSGLPFHPATPVRAFDTRWDGQPMGHGGERVVALGNTVYEADAVVLNVTVTDTTAAGFLTVWQDGKPRPITSNLNFPAGWTGANQVIVPVDQYESDIRLYNFGGSANVIVDVAGYFSYDTWGSTYLVPSGPTRVLDTRQSTAIGPRVVRELTIPGLPANAQGVVLNVTATEPTAAGFLTVWPGDTTRPNVSSLNFTQGQTVPNAVTVPVVNGKIQIYNLAGYTHVIVDVAGYYLRAY